MKIFIVIFISYNFSKNISKNIKNLELFQFYKFSNEIDKKNIIIINENEFRKLYYKAIEKKKFLKFVNPIKYIKIFIFFYGILMGFIIGQCIIQCILINFVPFLQNIISIIIIFFFNMILNSWFYKIIGDIIKKKFKINELFFFKYFLYKYKKKIFVLFPTIIINNLIWLGFHIIVVKFKFFRLLYYGLFIFVYIVSFIIIDGLYYKIFPCQIHFLSQYKVNDNNYLAFIPSSFVYYYKYFNPDNYDLNLDFNDFIFID